MSALSTHQQAENLPDNQRLALEALLGGGTQAEAAHAARASLRSVQRWLQDPVFVNALHQARCAAWMEATSRLQARANHAVDTLQAVMDCDRPHARVTAARAVLTLTLKSVELESIYQRALQVEKDLDNLPGPNPGGDPGPQGQLPVPAQEGTPPAPAAMRFQPVAGPDPVAEHPRRPSVYALPAQHRAASQASRRDPYPSPPSFSQTLLQEALDPPKPATSRLSALLAQRRGRPQPAVTRLGAAAHV